MRLLQGDRDAGERAGDVAAGNAGTSLAGTATAPTAIRAERLIREFGGMTAVDELDLDIRRREIYGFLGPNGAGNPVTGLRRSLPVGATATRRKIRPRDADGNQNVI